MDFEGRLNNREAWEKRKPKNEETYERAKILARDTIQLDRHNTRERVFGRMKAFGRLSALAIGAAPAFAEGVERVNELVGREIHNDVPEGKAYFFAAVAYAGSVLCKAWQNGAHLGAMELQEQMAKEYGDAGLATVHEAGERHVSRTLIG